MTGEIVDHVLEGALCSNCFEYFEDEAPGYPRLCDACADDGEDAAPDGLEVKSKPRKRGKKGRRG